MLKRNLIRCENEQDVGDRITQKCPFSCQSCENPGIFINLPFQGFDV